MDRRSYILLRRAALAGVVFSCVFVAGFSVYRAQTTIPGTSFGTLAAVLVALAGVAVGGGYVLYLWRLETRTGSTFTDAPRLFGGQAEPTYGGYAEYDAQIEPLPDGRFPREQSVPPNHTNAIQVSVHGKSTPTQLDVSAQPPTLSNTSEEWATAFTDLRNRYPIISQISRQGHRPVIDLTDVADLTRVERRDHPNPDGTITHLNVKKAPALVEMIDHPRGLELVFEPLPGQDLRMWSRAVGKMGTQLGLTSLSVRQEAARMVLAFNDKIADLPMDTKMTEPIPVETGTGRFLSTLGVSAYGPAQIQWANNSGMVCGGVPGSGKTASMLPVFAGLAGEAEIHVADGKLGLDLHPLFGICRTYDDRGGFEDGRLYALLKSLKFMVDSRARSQAIYSATGIANFWNSDPAVRKAAGLYPIFVIIDECQYWFDPGATGMSKEDKAACDAIVSITRELIQRGRSLGIMVVLTTQKPDGNTIPTVIRDNAALKVAYRVTTREQGKTILGAIGPDQESPVDISQESPGRCVMDIENFGSNLVQSNYVSPNDIAAWLTQYTPVPDQFAQACGYPLAYAMTAFHDGEDPPPLRINTSVDEANNFAVVDAGDIIDPPPVARTTLIKPTDHSAPTADPDAAPIAPHAAPARPERGPEPTSTAQDSDPRPTATRRPALDPHDIWDDDAP